jgi:hypothetical protein
MLSLKGLLDPLSLDVPLVDVVDSTQHLLHYTLLL